MTTKDLMQASYTLSKTGVTSKEAGVNFSKYVKKVNQKLKEENQQLKENKNRAINFCNYLLENDEVVINGVKYYKQESDDIITRAILEKLEV